MHAAALPLHSSPDWLDTTEIARIRRQFATIGNDADAFASEFYARLFSISPLVRAMFRGDMGEQRAKLVRMLAMLVSKLDAPEQLAIPLAALGERHRGYGVMQADFDPVGRALIATLAHYLGDEFDSNARAAWLKVYAWVTVQMQGQIVRASASA
jgi:hemoglobin-like flavoprotein